MSIASGTIGKMTLAPWKKEKDAYNIELPSGFR
jgi:hypothetical protein